jgi:hypothetical protein
VKATTLDHVAIALEHWSDAYPTLAIALGGAWRSGGYAPGFAPAQLGFANGMKVELLEPHDVERNDFLRRFLDRHGPGPHHYTFKVPSLDGALEAAAQAGLTPVGVDRSDPEWHEAFLHPKDTGLGIVVQLAEVRGAEWATDPPAGFPADADRCPPAALLRCEHRVPELEHGLALFGGLLGGERTASGEGWIELVWPGPGRIRLVTAETAGLDRLVFQVTGSPTTAIDAATIGAGIDLVDSP